MSNQNKLRASDLKFLNGKLSLPRSRIPRLFKKIKVCICLFTFILRKACGFSAIERKEINAFSRERILDSVLVWRVILINKKMRKFLSPLNREKARAVLNLKVNKQIQNNFFKYIVSWCWRNLRSLALFVLI
jgi:hypothetical protein